MKFIIYSMRITSMSSFHKYEWMFLKSRTFQSCNLRFLNPPGENGKKVEKNMKEVELGGSTHVRVKRPQQWFWWC